MRGSAFPLHNQLVTILNSAPFCLLGGVHFISLHMSSVFLSHNSADKKFVRRLAADLRLAGHVVWIDEAEINIGDSLIEKIREGIDEVEYVAVVLSRASIQSEWVRRELDIASNREIEEKRIVVLPLLLEDVEMPGFLKGKLYGDFRLSDDYHGSLSLLLRKLGPSATALNFDADFVAAHKKELEAARRLVAQHADTIRIYERVALKSKSYELRNAIEDANQKHPEHAPINVAYAFEVAGHPITLGYLLWCVEKSEMFGGHPIELLFTIEDKWGEAANMLEAYAEMLDSFQTS